MEIRGEQPRAKKATGNSKQDSQQRAEQEKHALILPAPEWAGEHELTATTRHGFCRHHDSTWHEISVNRQGIPVFCAPIGLE